MMNDKDMKIAELEGKVEAYREELREMRENLDYYHKLCAALKEKVAGARYLMKALVKDLEENIL